MMEWQLDLFVYIIVLLGLLASGVWIAFALALTGCLGLWLHSGWSVFYNLGMINWNAANSFTLTAVPLFLFMGEIILKSGLSNEFYRGLSVVLYRLPGGLIHTNITGCAIFSAISGSSVATAAAIGTAAIPELRKRGYDDGLTLGSLAAGGTLGILIPPSIVMIIYGDMVQESVAKLFVAGILPGVILVTLFMAYIILKVIRHPKLAPHEKMHLTWGEKLRLLLAGWPVMALMVFILGGIYMGLTTPTEAAALGACSAVLIGLLLKKISWPIIKEALKSTVRVTTMILFIYQGAQVFSFALVNAGVSRGLVTAVTQMNLPPTVFLIFVILLYLILGCFIDGISMMILTLPLLFPIITEMGFNPIWFGVIMTLLIEMGQITPPMGVNLFTIHGIAGNISISDVVIASIPYWVMLLITVLLIMLIPGLAVWLPQIMFK
jgi:tripartite ATP-independent transporter DctM subunit